MILRTSLLIFLIIAQIHIFGQTFQIDFTQGGQTFRGDSARVIQLKKQPFIIAVELDSLDGVFAHCSARPIIAYGAEKRKIPDFENIGWKVTFETEFNKDKELFLNTINDYCYWFYDAQQAWHRFDSAVVVKEDLVQAHKTVRQFYDIEQGKNIAIAEISKKLYLTFFSINGSFTDESARLDQVRTYQLIFED
jgi:hypothetical protein